MPFPHCATHILPYLAQPAWRVRILSVVLWVAMVACASPRMHYDYDTEADFDQRSYAWLDGRPDRAGLSPMAESFLQSELEERLQGKGLERGTDQPELFLTYYQGQQAPIRTQAAGYAYWPPQWARGGYPGGAEGYAFSKKTIVIDLIDAENRQLIWRGSIRGLLSGALDKRIEKVEAGLDSLFAHFPPPALAPGPED